MSETYKLIANGKTYHFERDYTGGPWFVNPKTNAVRNQPESPRHPFWIPFYCWLVQGEKVVDGVCQWELLPPRKVRAVHLGGRQWKQLGKDDPPDPDEQTLVFPHDEESLWELYISKKHQTKGTP